MKRFWRLLAVALTLTVLAGCSGLSYEDLYSLPRATEDYYDLQEALNEVLEDGYDYLAPTSGARQEPVQMTDLDGDGVDEAVVFLRTSDHGEVKIYIFSKNGDAYSPAVVIDGAGSAVASVEYADLDGQGDLELIVTYQVSESVSQALQVYRYSAGEATSMLTAGCSQSELSDLDGDGLQEVFCISGSGSDSLATLECYDYREGELQRIGEQRLGFSYASLRQVQQGKLSADCSGIIFSGVGTEGQLLLDVFTADESGLVAISPQQEILTSLAIHSYYVYPDDLDGDGLLEIPQTRQLAAFDDGSSAQWVIDWYGLEANGSCEREFTTFENFSENWYFVIPEAWNEGLTIKAADETTTVSTVSFYRLEDEESPQEIMTIYTLQGTERQTYAQEHSLTILLNDSETIFAVTLAAAEPWEGTVTMAQVSELFHYTRTGWSEETSAEQN